MLAEHRRGGGEERAPRPAEQLDGRAIPPLRLATFTGTPVELHRDTVRRIVIYVYPGSAYSPDGGSASRAGDAAQHRAFDRHRDELEVRGLTAVGLSSESQRAQRTSVFENRICHELWNDSDLQLAQALGLPTFEHDGVSCYRRLTIVAWGGRIEKAFFPVESAQRSASQVIGWLKATGR